MTDGTCASGRGRTGRAAPAGFTLVEVLIVISIMGILFMIAAPSFRGLSNDLENASAETAGFLRQARTKAITTTSAYRVIFESTTHLRVEHARRCDDTTWTADAGVQLYLREGAQLDGTGLTAGDVLMCYNSRGIADASPMLVVRDQQGFEYKIETFLGGAVRVTGGS